MSKLYNYESRAPVEVEVMAFASLEVDDVVDGEEEWRQVNPLKPANNAR